VHFNKVECLESKYTVYSLNISLMQFLQKLMVKISNVMFWLHFKYLAHVKFNGTHCLELTNIVW